jgi:hypothetical protein
MSSKTSFKLLDEEKVSSAVSISNVDSSTFILPLVISKPDSIVDHALSPSVLLINNASFPNGTPKSGSAFSRFKYSLRVGSASVLGVFFTFPLIKRILRI